MQEIKLNNVRSIIDCDFYGADLTMFLQSTINEDGSQTFFCARSSDKYSSHGRFLLHVLNTSDELKDLKYNLIGQKRCELEGLPFADEKKLSFTEKIISVFRGK